MIDILLLTVETDEDREKIINLYEKYYSLVAYVVRQVTDFEDEVDDIVQETFLKIIENFDIIDLSNEKKIKGLFLTIAKNKAIDHCKCAERKNTSVDDVFFNAVKCGSAEDAVLKKELSALVKNAICSLNEYNRTACLLKYYYGYSEKEIALLLDLSPKVVNQRIFRGKQHIKKYLKEVEALEYVK